MNLKTISSMLKGEYSQVTFFDTADIPITLVKVLSPASLPLSPDTLYIAEKAIPANMLRRDIPYLLVSDRLEGIECKRCILVETDKSFITVVNRVAALFAQNAATAASKRRLLEALSDDSANIVETVSDELGCPVCVYCHGAGIIYSSSKTHPFPENIAQADSDSDDYVFGTIYKHGCIQRLKKGTTFALTDIKLGETYYCLCMLEPKADDAMYLELASMCLHVLAMTYETGMCSHSGKTLVDALFRKLLMHNDLTENDYQQIRLQMKLSEKNKYYILVANNAGGFVENSFSAWNYSYLLSLSGAFAYTRADGYSAFLIVSQYYSAPYTPSDELISFCAKNDITACVSFPFYSLSLSKTFFAQTANCLSTMTPTAKSSVFTYESVLPEFVLKMMNGYEDTAHHCMPEAIELKKWSRLKGQPFLETLTAYIRNSKNKSATADSLGISRAELRQRLESIGQLITLDFDDPIQMMMMYFSLKSIEQELTG